MRHRVLLVISNLGYGGAERQVIEIANGLGAHDIEGHVCILSSHAPMASALVGSEHRLHRIEKHNRFDISVVWRLARLMKALDVDVVHGFLFDAEIATRLAARLAGVSYVVGSERNSVHNYKAINYWAYRLTSPLMSVCVANSEAGKRFNMTQFGLPEERYRVVYNGVDTARFQPRDQGPAREALGIEGEGLVVGMVGSFKRQKNHGYLLRVVGRLAAQGIDFQLLLVGTTIFEGDSESEAYFRGIETMINEMALGDRVRLLGPRTDVETVYNACDVTVLPSLFEGTPNVALESLASGVPVIATDVSDNAIVIPDGEVGFIVGLEDEEAFANRLRELLVDGELRQRFGDAARALIMKRFSQAIMVENMVRVYEHGEVGR